MSSIWIARIARFLGIRPDAAAQYSQEPEQRLAFSRIAAEAKKLGAAGLLYRGRLGAADVWLLLTPTDTFEHHLLIGHPEFLLAYGERLVKTDGAAIPALLNLHRKKTQKKRGQGAQYESLLADWDGFTRDGALLSPSYSAQLPVCERETERVDQKKALRLRSELLACTQNASSTWMTFCEGLQSFPATKTADAACALQAKACERLLPAAPRWKQMEYRRRAVLLHQAASATLRSDRATLRMVREKPISDPAGKVWPLTGIDLVWILDNWELTDLFPELALRDRMEKLVQDYFSDHFAITVGRCAVAAAGLLLPKSHP